MESNGILKLNISMLEMPHMYFPTPEEYKGALLFLLWSLHNTVPGPMKETRELEAIVADDREGFKEAHAWYVRTLKGKTNECVW